MMEKQPEIEVGILLCQELRFELAHAYRCNGQLLQAGAYTAIVEDDQVLVSQGAEKKLKAGGIMLTPVEADAVSYFELKDVTIGKDFHWEQKENQRFRGTLKLIPEAGKVRAVNSIRLEEYLQSVISSEMSATGSPEFLKAHAVVSRSWLLAQIKKKRSLKSGEEMHQTSFETEDEITRWYDREEHSDFDVCADDHCQRYQGITRIQNQEVLKAVEVTAGEVLVYEDKICDARFSKCCGGISENFENVWEPIRHRYLTKVVDSEFGDTTCVDLRNEEESQLWIRNAPHAFCNTSNKDTLLQVLPTFDQATVDFFRWEKTYTQDELAQVIRKRSGIDFGQIVKLEPVKRGHSGRLIKLKIHGTKKILTIGKELEIRKWLSESHLYSSAFVVDHLDVFRGIPQKIVLKGAGWGHGVGMCQIGAAVMGEKGYSYQAILSHYFQAAEIKKAY